jgi:glycerophosphoryl diester phosphodiesterase
MLSEEWLAKFGWPVALHENQPFAIAHRGASDYAPENTRKAFRIADELFAEMWEIDVRLSADGVCVVAHDDNLIRTAGRDLTVSGSDWNRIKDVRLAEGERIVCLDDVIDLALELNRGLYVEVKAEGAGVAAWQLLRKAEFRFAAIGSFVTDWVRELRDAGCEYPLSVLVPAGRDPFVHSAIADPDLIHLCWRDMSDRPDRLVTQSLISQAQQSNIGLILWHEERPDVLDAMLELDVAGICSNRPEMLKPHGRGSVPVQIVCHRGCNFLGPENTLEAARICLDQKLDFIELDVRTTADGALAVIHDATLERTTNGQGAVSARTLSQLRTLDAGCWFSELTAGARIPTLEEMLLQARGRAGVYIEIKQADPDAVLATVENAGVMKNVFFWSGNTDVLRHIRRCSSDIRLIVERARYTSLQDALDDYGAQIVQFTHGIDDLAEVKRCAGLGVRSMIFTTLDDWHILQEIAQHQPDMVNLDRPDRYKIMSSYPHLIRASAQAHKNKETAYG